VRNWLEFRIIRHNLGVHGCFETAQRKVTQRSGIIAARSRHAVRSIREAAARFNSDRDRHVWFGPDGGRYLLGHPRLLHYICDDHAPAPTENLQNSTGGDINDEEDWGHLVTDQLSRARRVRCALIPIGKARLNLKFIKGQRKPEIQGWYSP